MKYSYVLYFWFSYECVLIFCDFIHLVYTLKKWNEPLANNRLVLICSDSMMFDFYIDNADCLIHYDIPEAKQSFSRRFSVLQDSSNKLVVSFL